MTAVDFKKGAESLASIAYERDPLGQVEAMVSEGLPGPEEETYEYDANNRLLKAGSESFEYDKADNPIKTPGSTNSFDNANQLEAGTGVSYEYSPLGERVKATSSGPATNYAYDQAGRLTSVKRAEEGEVPGIDKGFAYDGSGLLASQTSGLTTQYMAWDLSSPLPLLLTDGVNSYVYGPHGLPIAQISAEEEPTYLHHDQLGSTRLLTDATGKAAASLTYTAYGELASKTGAATTPLGYAGQYTDADTGLQYLRARFYDPATGQFLSRDPAEALTREPYAYGHSNPVSNVDPTGLYPAEEEGELECWGCLRFPTAEEIEDAAEEVSDAANDFWNWITDDDDSTTETQPTLSKAEQEYEEEHHECPLERDWAQDKKVTDRELKEAGIDAHGEKRGQKGTDIYKDREGNLYEKPKGGRGPGDPLGINIKDLFR
jgi:RHS repeat-associated protein